MEAQGIALTFLLFVCIAYSLNESSADYSALFNCKKTETRNLHGSDVESKPLVDPRVLLGGSGDLVTGSFRDL